MNAKQLLTQLNRSEASILRQCASRRVNSAHLDAALYANNAALFRADATDLQERKIRRDAAHHKMLRKLGRVR